MNIYVRQDLDVEKKRKRLGTEDGGEEAKRLKTEALQDQLENSCDSSIFMSIRSGTAEPWKTVEITWIFFLLSFDVCMLY